MDLTKNAGGIWTLRACTILRLVLFVVASQGVIWGASADAGDPIVVVHGVWGDAKKTSVRPEDCTVAISRQQFDDLMHIVSPDGPVSAVAKHRFAKAYAEVLVVDRAARELGIDSSAEYQQTMRWLQEKPPADLLRRRLEKESCTVSEAETEA